MLKIIIKKADGTEWQTPNTSNVHHKGDRLFIDGSWWIVVGGDILP